MIGATSRRPRLLDLFCGVGGAGAGYAAAGFDVTGVDLADQPNYPFEFIRADVMALDVEFLAQFDAVHASPPCQSFTTISKVNDVGGNYPDLIEPVREMLNAAGVVYAIENVVGAKPKFKSAIMLCGTMFDLGAAGAEIRRHRWFELSFPVAAFVPPCRHGKTVMTVTGETPQQNVVRNTERRTFTRDDARAAMGISWAANMRELSQAIPPAFTQWIGQRMQEELGHG